MRRNLTLEETGVLDLRKFQSVDEIYFNIPIDWLILQGLSPLSLDDASKIGKFLKSKFNIFIVGSNKIQYASTSLNSGDNPSEIATFSNEDYIHVDSINDGVVTLTY